MKEVSGRMFALCADIARVDGVGGPDLFRGLEVALLPAHGQPEVVVDTSKRASFLAFLTLLARLRDRLGGDEALAHAFARSPLAVPELITFAADFESPLELARFANTVLVPGYFTCLHTVMAPTRESSYDIWLVPQKGYETTASLVHAFAGLLRGLPRFLELGEATVVIGDSGRDSLFRVTLPVGTGKARHRSGLRAEDNERANAFIDALVADGEAYRRGAETTEEMLRVLGHATESAPSSRAFGRIAVEVLARGLSLERCVLWSADDATRLAETGSRSAEAPAPTISVELVLAGERLGRLEVPEGCSREGLEAVLPLIAWGLHRRARPEAAPSIAEVPALYVDPAWKLTKRQTEVVALVVAGHSNGQIAARLGCAVGTIEDRLTAIYAKTGVDGRLGLAVRVLDAGAERGS